jgi:hypothetical protein
MPPKPKFKKENDVATRSEIEALFRPSDEMVEALDQVFEEAVRKGIIVDSGKRKWSERTGRYEIIWESKLVQ